MTDRDFIRTLAYQGFTARIKRLSDKIGHSCRSYYTKSGLGIQQNWHLVFLLLKQERTMTITEIAARLRYSHPAIIKITQKMEDAGFLERFADKQDQRKQLLRLTEKALTALPSFESEWTKIETAIESLVGQKFMKELEALEDRLDARNLLDRCFGDFEVQYSICKQENAVDAMLIKRVSPLDENVIALIEKLNVYQIDLYGPSKCNLESPSSLKKNHAYMVGAFISSELVGIGGVKLHKDYAEIKRMYVEMEYRGLSIAAYILNHLEDYARQHQINSVCLETGFKHEAALRFYKNAGYEQIEKFGDYQPNDVSRYFEKKLSNS